MAVPAAALRTAAPRLSRIPAAPEEEGLLRQTGQSLLSGLGWVGESLTKPSRAVHGTLSGLTGGDWGGGLLNIVPFSDTMGLTDPRQGLELSQNLERLGAIPENKPGFDWWDPVRLGANIAGDPLTWTTGLGFAKALGPAAQALKNANVLDDVVKASGKGAREFLAGTTAREALAGLSRPQLRSVQEAAKGLGFRSLKEMTEKSPGPIGGVLGLNMPFRQPFKTFGTPGLGRAADVAGEALRWNPVSREAFRMFSHSVKGGRSRAEQEFGKALTTAERAAESAVDKFTLGIMKRLKDTSPDLTKTREGREQLRNMVEGMTDGLPPELVKTVQAEFAQGLAGTADEVSYTLSRLFNEYRRVGGRMEELKDDIPYFPRQVLGESGEKHSIARRPYLRGFESVHLDRMLRNPELLELNPSAAKLSDIENWIAKRYGDVIPAEYQALKRDGTPLVHNQSTIMDDLVKQNTKRLLEEGRAARRAAKEGDLYTREWKENHADIARRARRNPELDADALGMDEAADELRRLFNDPDITASEALDLLRAQPQKFERLTRKSVEREARQLAADEFASRQHEFADLIGQPVVKQDRYRRLAALIKSSAKEAPERFQEGLFQDPLESMYRYMQAVGRGITRAQGVTEALADARFLGEATALRPGEKGVSVGRMLEGMGLDADVVLKNVGLDIKHVRMSDSVVQRLNKMVEFGRRTEDRTLIERLWSFQNNLFKASVTSPWTAFHGRNWVGSQIQNIITGLLRPTRALAENRNAHRLLTGQTVPDAHTIPVIRRRLQERGLEINAENGTESLRHLIAEKQVWSPHETIGMGTDIVGAGADPTSLQRLTSRAPGGLGGEQPLMPPGPLSPAREIGRRYVGLEEGTTLNPLRAQIRGGMTGAEHSTFGPFAAGELAGTWIEGQNRIPAFMDQLRRGIDPDVAARNVSAAQVSYAARDFTATERAIKQVIPFYSFGSRQAHFVTNEVLNRPGGPMAQIIKQQSRVGRDDEDLPPYLRGSLSVPLGESPEGDKRFLTGLGLMHEGSFLNVPTAVGGVPSFGETGAQALASLSPAIKGPLEAVTGESFFMRGPLGGRELESMDPAVGGAIANIRQLAGGERPYPADPLLGSRGLEQIIANSPLSRAATTARTLTDVRKHGPELASELLTGLRVTDVSPQQQESILRERLAAAMREAGAAKFETIRFTSRQIADAPEDKAEQMRRFNALAARIQREQASARRRRQEQEGSRVRLRPLRSTL